MRTLVFIRHHNINGREYHHGAELPPGMLTQEQIAEWLDRGALRECDSAQRRSLYRLFSAFSGSEESEQLEESELDEYCLTE